PVAARWRAPGDLVEIAGEVERNAVLSRVPEPAVHDLRASAALGDAVPPDLSRRYLALPDSLPPRVVALAREVVSDAPTRYDAVLRLERYLRTYAYELDLPEPPDDRDLVDYFLFDRQEGYCDYYASALVVMARAVGVPARLATGYAQGTYDPEARRWVVTAQDGHSWPEVYFDGIGWVEFEPTAGQAALARPGSTAAAETLPPLPRHPPRWWQQVPWGLVALVGAVVGLGGLLAWLWQPGYAPVGGELVQDRYGRLLHWGGRLHHPLRDGQTPREYAQSLGATLRARGSKARWPRARRAAEEVPGDVDDLVEAFVESRYSPRPTPERTTWHIHALWVRLRRNLLTLWLRLPARHG
ncbi:MAG TPA: transglutaminase-like domain-containing protein, partial [Anaerolineae bacterium]|nr:transglutaminase-like domain-containing protein [Anaerolineae bacterium]